MDMVKIFLIFALFLKKSSLDTILQRKHRYINENIINIVLNFKLNDTITT